MELAGAIYLIGAVITGGAAALGGECRGLRIRYGAALLTILAAAWPIFAAEAALDLMAGLLEEWRGARKQGPALHPSSGE